MAIVVYKCDVCKREIELERNTKGLENIQRCTITHGCRGKLYQTQVLQDFVRGKLPDPVLGLDDWRQRKVLYNHEQTIERDQWIVEHNLGTTPALSVYVDLPTEADPDNRSEIQPTDVQYINEDTLVITFDRAWSGLAQLVARQSDPDLLRPSTGLVISTEDLQQISSSGEIAIATRISTVGEADTVTLNVEYSTPQNTVVTNTYDVPTSLEDSNSSWRDIDKVIIKGKIYTIRSFDGIYSDITNDVVASGSTFRFTAINEDPSGSGVDRDIAEDEVYILFAQAPYDSVDKETDQYIDVSDVTLTQNQFALVYDTNEFYADPDIIQNVYPPIRSV